MSRIRSVKPEFWTSAQVTACSPNARLLFIGLWNFCDDAGRHPLSPRTIKAEVLPADDFTGEDVRRMLDELSANGLVVFYAVDGKDYLQVTGWRHQKIDRPQPARHPPISDAARRSFVERSSTDGRGEEPKGREAASSLPRDGSNPAPSREAGPSRDHAAAQQSPRKPRPDGWSKALETRLLAESGLRDQAAASTSLLDVSPIVRLLDEGFDLEGEILPVIRARTGPHVRRWAYFETAIREARARPAAVVVNGHGGGPGSAVVESDDDRWRARIEHYRRTRRWQIPLCGERVDAPAWVRSALDEIDASGPLPAAPVAAPPPAA